MVKNDQIPVVSMPSRVFQRKKITLKAITLKNVTLFAPCETSLRDVESTLSLFLVN